MLGFLPLFSNPDQGEESFSARHFMNTTAISLARQQEEFGMVKRDRWTEADVLALGPDEQDTFERKAGQLYDAGMEGFQNTVAKALSAFSNSGGGSIVLGMADDRTFDGLPPMVGRASMRDWVETKIPPLLDYPLSDFRVHTVIATTPSLIPAQKVVLVVDVGDSAVFLLMITFGAW